jgi:hypothetical protein
MAVNIPVWPKVSQQLRLPARVMRTPDFSYVRAQFVNRSAPPDIEAALAHITH